MSAPGGLAAARAPLPAAGAHVVPVPELQAGYQAEHGPSVVADHLPGSDRRRRKEAQPRPGNEALPAEAGAGGARGAGMKAMC